MKPFIISVLCALALTASARTREIEGQRTLAIAISADTKVASLGDLHGSADSRQYAILMRPN
jgi:hypothetical protein